MKLATVPLLRLLSTLLPIVPPRRLLTDSPTYLLFYLVPSYLGSLSDGLTLSASLPLSLDLTYYPLFDPTYYPLFNLTLILAAVVEAVERQRSKRSPNLNTTLVV